MRCQIFNGERLRTCSRLDINSRHVRSARAVGTCGRLSGILIAQFMLGAKGSRASSGLKRPSCKGLKNDFVANAQLLRKREMVEKSIPDNAEIVIPSGSELINVIGKTAGVVPLSRNAR